MSHAIAEIVTFQLVEGADPAAFGQLAAAGVDAFLLGRGALGRTLSVGADGRWTDHVLWPSMAEAEAAAAEIGRSPHCTPFLGMIAGPSVMVRHETVQSRA